MIPEFRCPECGAILMDGDGEITNDGFVTRFAPLMRAICIPCVCSDPKLARAALELVAEEVAP